MIPKEAIEKAIEGGWKSTLYNDEQWEQVKHLFATSGIPETETGQAIIALDPTFWQCLGKALGPFADGDGILRIQSPRAVAIHDEKIDWGLYTAHRFYYLILTNGNTDAFWKELLTK